MAGTFFAENVTTSTTMMLHESEASWWADSRACETHWQTDRQTLLLNSENYFWQVEHFGASVSGTQAGAGIGGNSADSECINFVCVCVSGLDVLRTRREPMGTWLVFSALQLVGSCIGLFYLFGVLAPDLKNVGQFSQQQVTCVRIPVHIVRVTVVCRYIPYTDGASSLW